MTYKLTIPGRLPGLNQYIAAERAHRLRGAEMKANCEYLIVGCIHRQLGRIRLNPPVEIVYRFIEPDRRRDKSNISSFGRKVIEDSLIKSGLLKNDGWNDIGAYRDEFAVDAKNPRIEITITEVNR